jgi:short subunit dehydrogenase-like uncharacterized protein
MAEPTWLIYGATGFTGRLVAAEAVRRGLAPILAGRHDEAVLALAEELKLPARVFTLDSPKDVQRGLEGVRLVLHCAGPFVITSRPMVDVCLGLRAHYLDITGEIPVFEAVLARDGEAKQAGIALVPGVGFDVVPTDCLAALLLQDLPDAIHLDLAFTGERGSWSAGTLKTAIEAMPGAGAVRRDGRIVEVTVAHEVRDIVFSCGRRTTVTVPWGDVSTAYHTTGIPNIRVYTGMSPQQINQLRKLAKVLPAMRVTAVKRLAQWWVGRSVKGPDEKTRATARAYLWGRASNERGLAVTRTMETPEGYTLTALAAVECAARVLAGRIKPGAWTPARAFGPGLAESLPGVTVGDVLRGV